MTDHDLAVALKDLSKSVTDHRYEIGRDLATLTANVGTLQTAHEGNAKKLDKVLELELSCAARAGFEGQNARLKQLEIGEKLRIESELQQARDEVTGQQDVAKQDAMQRRIGERNYSETPPGRFFKFILPYAWKGIIIFGIAVGASAVARCSAPTMTSIQAITDMVKKTAADVDKVKVKVDEVAADSDPDPGMSVYQQ